MNSLVKENLKNLKEVYKQQVEDIKKTEEDLTIIQKLVPKGKIWLDADINLSVPSSSMTEVKDLLKLLAKNNIHLERHQPNETTPKWYLQGKNVIVILTPIWSREEDAICHLIQVGEIVNRYPQYKLVCNEEEFEESA